MMLFDRPAISLGAIYIDPKVDIKGRSPYGNSTNAKDIAPSAVIPNAHFIFPINDKWAVGSSITSNFGLATDFKRTMQLDRLVEKPILKQPILTSVVLTV